MKSSIDAYSNPVRQFNLLFPLAFDGPPLFATMSSTAIDPTPRDGSQGFRVHNNTAHRGPFTPRRFGSSLKREGQRISGVASFTSPTPSAWESSIFTRPRKLGPDVLITDRPVIALRIL